MRQRLLLLVCGLACLLAPVVAPAASFELLGRFAPDLPYASSHALAVSADGEVVVGASRSPTSLAHLPFRWTAPQGMVNFLGLTGDEDGVAYDVSSDGSVVVGRVLYEGGMGGAFRWTQQGGGVILPSLPGWPDDSGVATGVSADGSVVVGYSYLELGPQRVFRWREAEGLLDLGVGYEPHISADGSVIVANDGEQGAFRWTEATGRVYLGTAPDAFGAPFALDVSADGSTVVGRILYELPTDEYWQAFRWTQDEGLALLLGPPSEGYHAATGVSGDGSVVVGTSEEGFIWDATHGARSLRLILEDEYGLNTRMFSRIAPISVSADALVIVGAGDYPDGRGGEAWRAVIPEPSTTVLLVTGLLALLLFAWRTRNGMRAFSIPCSFWKGDETMLRNLCVFPLVVLFVLSGSAEAAAVSFELLGQFPHPDYPSSHAYGVSADGEVVVGDSRMQVDSVEGILPFRWTGAEGMVNFFGVGPGQGGAAAYNVSADGSVIVGKGGFVGGPGGAFRWTEQEGPVFLPDVPGWEDYSMKATGVSADGSVIVGEFWRYTDDYHEERLFRWTEAEGTVDLGPQSSPYLRDDPKISADGSVIVANDGEGAFRWTEGTGRVYLGTLPDAAGPAHAYNVSADGSVIVGNIAYDIGEPGDQAFRWTEEEGIVLLFGTPQEEFGSAATAASADGSVIVGVNYDTGGFIWDAAHGPRDLRDVLQSDYALEIGDFYLGWPNDISPDGRVIVGTAEHTAILDPADGFEAWRAVIPEPSTISLIITGLLALVLFAWRKRNGAWGSLSSLFVAHSTFSGRRHTMNRFIVSAVALFALAVCQPSKAEWMFRGLGILRGTNSSQAYGISADGKVVVGASGNLYTYQQEAFLWTAEGGMVGLGFPPNPYRLYSAAWGVSADGTVVVGDCSTDRGNEAFRWTATGGMVPLGDLGSPQGEFRSVAHGVSADGSVVVGVAETDPDENLPFRWTVTEGMVGLGYLPGGYHDAGATGVSADGSVVVGYSSGEAFRWTESDGIVGLGSLPHLTGSAAHAISADGRVVVGYATDAVDLLEPFRWTQEDGMVGLRMLPGERWNTARAVSADGSTIVGGGEGMGRPFIWDETHGMRNLRDVVVTQGGVDPEDWWLGSVRGISDDGRTIVGTGAHHLTPEESRHEAWIVVIPEPPTSLLIITALVTFLLVARRQRNGILRTFCSIWPSY